LCSIDAAELRRKAHIWQGRIAAGG